MISLLSLSKILISIMIASKSMSLIIKAEYYQKYQIKGSRFQNKKLDNSLTTINKSIPKKSKFYKEIL